MSTSTLIFSFARREFSPFAALKGVLRSLVASYSREGEAPAEPGTRVLPRLGSATTARQEPRPPEPRLDLTQRKRRNVMPRNIFLRLRFRLQYSKLGAGLSERIQFTQSDQGSQCHGGRFDAQDTWA